MKTRFLMFRRANGVFYCEDTETRKQESLETKDRAEAKRLTHAKNEAQLQPHLNLQIARAYLMGSDPEVGTRTWQDAMETISKTKTGPTLRRWKMAIKDKPFDLIRNLPILRTQAQHFLKVLEKGTVSTNVFLRRVHNFALDMSWLPWPVIVKRQWPRVVPAKSIADATHIAIAAASGMDFLLTWNCAHIANAQIEARVNDLCREHGFQPPVICTPEELLVG